MVALPVTERGLPRHSTNFHPNIIDAADRFAQTPNDSKNAEIQDALERLATVSQELNPTAVLSWFQKKIEQAIARIRFKLNGIKVHDYAFNYARLLQNTERLQNLTIDELLQLLKQDYEYYIREYVLREHTGEIIMNLHDLTSTGYTQEHIRDMCDNLVQQLTKEGRAARRAEVERFMHGVFLPHWFNTHTIGAKLVMVSPPGKKTEGYAGEGKHNYSYIYHFEIVEQDGEKRLRMQWKKAWFSHKDHTHFFKKLGKPFPKHWKLSSHTLILHAVETQQTSLEVYAMVDAMPQIIPKEQKEIETDSKAFWQQIEKVYQQFFTQTAHPLLVQAKEHGVTQRLIDAFEIVHSLFIRKVSHLAKNSTFIHKSELEEMLHACNNLVEVALSNTSQTEKKQKTQTALGVLGGLHIDFGSIASVGQCMGGSLLNFQTLTSSGMNVPATGPFGIIKNMQEACSPASCPNCGTPVVGKTICSSCGMKKGGGFDPSIARRHRSSSPQTPRHSSPSTQQPRGFRLTPENSVGFQQALSGSQESTLGLSQFVMGLAT